MFRKYFVFCFHFVMGYVVFVCCEYGVCYDCVSGVYVVQELCVCEYVFYFLCELIQVGLIVVGEGA